MPKRTSLNILIIRDCELADDELLALLHIYTRLQALCIDLYTIEVVDRSIVVGNNLSGNDVLDARGTRREHLHAGDGILYTIELEGLET